MKANHCFVVRAASGGNVEVSKMLLQRGANVNDRDNFSCTALIWAVGPNRNTSKTRTSEILQILLEAGVEVNAKESLCGNTALHYAVELADLACVRCLVENGADVQETDKNQVSALMLATYRGEGGKEIVQFLVETGADIEAVDSEGFTALLYASRWGNLEVLQALVEEGAQIDWRDNHRNTALIHAARYGSLETVRFLLRKKVKINEKNDDGSSALMIALDNENIEVLRFLIEQGAAINERNNAGESAFMRAAKKGDLESLRILEGHGADANDLKGFELQVSVLAEVWMDESDEDAAQALQFLIEKECRFDDDDGSGQMALKLARDSKERTKY